MLCPSAMSALIVERNSSTICLTALLRMPVLAWICLIMSALVIGVIDCVESFVNAIVEEKGNTVETVWDKECRGVLHTEM